jgi:hypothetical protein
MLNNFYNYSYSPYVRQPIIPSYIRILHAVPHLPAVDVYANGVPIARNIIYGGFSQYLAVPGGSYHIIIYPAGLTANPLLNTNITIPGGSIFTISAIGTIPDIALLPVEEPRMTIPNGQLMIRFVNLSPNSPAIDVDIQGGNQIISNVAYKGVSQYVPLNPGTYAFSLKVAGTEQRLLYVPNIRLEAGKFYTINAIGILTGNPPLQVLIPLDGNTYIR